MPRKLKHFNVDTTEQLMLIEAWTSLNQMLPFHFETCDGEKIYGICACLERISPAVIKVAIITLEQN